MEEMWAESSNQAGTAATLLLGSFQIKLILGSQKMFVDVKLKAAGGAAYTDVIVQYILIKSCSTLVQSVQKRQMLF